MIKQTQERERERSERDKRIIRRELVAYLNKFNADNYPTVEPLLRRAKMDFFAIEGGHVLLGDDTGYDGYYVALGRKPQVVIHGTHWGYPLIDMQTPGFRAFDLDKGRINLPKSVGGLAHFVDIAETALTYSDQDYSSAVGEYKRKVEEDFPRHLDFLMRYIACREDKK